LWGPIALLRCVSVDVQAFCDAGWRRRDGKCCLVMKEKRWKLLPCDEVEGSRIEAQQAIASQGYRGLGHWIFW
jgi:hypothetical protein